MVVVVVVVVVVVDTTPNYLRQASQNLIFVKFIFERYTRCKKKVTCRAAKKADPEAQRERFRGWRAGARRVGMAGRVVSHTYVGRSSPRRSSSRTTLLARPARPRRRGPGQRPRPGRLHREVKDLWPRRRCVRVRVRVRVRVGSQGK